MLRLTTTDLHLKCMYILTLCFLQAETVLIWKAKEEKKIQSVPRRRGEEGESERDQTDCFLY